jgi:hypothetical protein
MGKAVKIIPVKNRLGLLLRMPGGIGRSEAVEAAGKAVEELREEFVGAIPGEIQALEGLVAGGRKKISAEELETMLMRAAQLLTLSGTFGYDLLDQVVKRFCDLASGMIEKHIEDVAAVNVHLRAMRLVCPGGAELAGEAADNILNGLAKVHAHYGIQRLQQDAIADQAAGPSAR